MSDLPPPTPPEAPSEPPVYSAPPPPPPPEEPTPAGSDSVEPSSNDPQPKNENEKTMGLLMHVIPLAGMVLNAAHIPFGNVIAPLIFWLIKKNESPYLDATGKEVMNFQINVAAVSLVGIITIPLFCIGVAILIALGITALILMILAAMAVSNGKFYRYPYIYRVIK